MMSGRRPITEAGRPGARLVTHAATLMRGAPSGPVYPVLPREPLMERVPASAPAPRVQVAAVPAAADPGAPATLSQWLAAAKSPLVLTKRGDTDGRLGAALAAFADHHAVAVPGPQRPALRPPGVVVP